ncbi:MAG: cold shock and DUF1294 domain-containing protein [Pseudomonadales bacterium]|nr:cold shock and DUF1294 domain-containing protein [Pseudomonadales bacterium]
MRQKGKLRSWNDDRGFGFIEPSDGGKDIFLHISALSNRDRRPEIGQIVTYALSSDDKGRPRANKATLPGDPLPVHRNTGGALFALVVAGSFFALVGVAVISAKIPPIILWIYLGASMVTFAFYASDKSAAKVGAWRTKESTLHWLSLAGGWPGALVAQQTLRHKSRKEIFRIVYWMTVILNLVVFAWIFTPMGAMTVESWISEGKLLVGPGQRATIEWAEP